MGDINRDISRRAFLGRGGATVSGLIAMPAVLQGLFPDGAQARSATEVRDALAARNVRVTRPVAVTSVQGSVARAAELIRGGTATLTAKLGRTTPQIVVDYGKVTGGRPIFTIRNVKGDVNLRAIYSESLPYLLPVGDGPGPGTPLTSNAAEMNVSFCGSATGANLSRIENYYPKAGKSELITARLLQAGQRFEALQLFGDGSIDLGVVGLLPSVRLDNPSDPGSFQSSDPALDEIFELGAHSVNVCAVPIGSVPGYYQATPDGLLFYGSWYGGYWPGTTWTDYTASFTVTILEHEAAWVVRGGLDTRSQSGIGIVLCADGDPLGSVLQPPSDTANTLRIYNIETLSLIENIDLPFTVTTGTPYDVVTTVSGNTLTVSINGTQVYSDIPAGMNATGWFGFINAQGAFGLAKNLLVTDGSGSTLLQESLRDRNTDAFINACAAGTNVLPSVMDGAKRDRMAFTGDMGISTKTILATSFDNQYITGTFDLFAQYQASDGGIPTSAPGMANAAFTGQGVLGGSGNDYTTMFFTFGYDYWFYTGDMAWLTAHRPVLRGALKKVLSGLGSNTLARGSVGSPFGSELGASAHIYGALVQAAQMATAVGDSASAATYAALAPQVGNAINTLLFDASVGLYQAGTTTPGVFDQQGNGEALLYGVHLLPSGPGVAGVNTSQLDTLLAGSGIGPVDASNANKTADISVYLTGWEILGRLSVGDAAGSLARIRAVWGAMLKSNPFYSGACFEYINQDTTPGLGSGTSLAHGWSSGATPALQQYFLGGRPLTPGFATFLVEPQTGGSGSSVFPTQSLTWAKGAVPTPRGPIGIQWNAAQRGRFTLDVKVPRGTTGFAGVPTSATELTVDGRRRTGISVPGQAGLDGYLYAGPLGAGVHKISTEK